MPISANNKLKIATSLIAIGTTGMILITGFGAFSSSASLSYLYMTGVSFLACGACVIYSIPRETNNANIDRSLLDAPPMYSPPPSYNVSLENIPENTPLTRILSTIPNEEPPSYEITISENTSNQTSQTR